MIPVMSFWPSVYKNIENQIKILEYRRVFPKNCEYAYMYVSKPVKAILGIIEFGKKYSLEDWKIQFREDDEIQAKIESFSNSYKYAMEIKSFQKIKPITLETLKLNIPNFVAPQSYCILENNPILMEYILKNTVRIDEKKVNNLDDVLSKHICMRY